MIEPSNELVDLMHRWYAGFSAGNFDAIADLLAEDPALLSIGTDPAEWLVGYEVIAPLYRAQIGAVGGVRIEATDLVAYYAGDVGWVADRPVVTLPDGTSFTLRSTLVFLRTDGAWRLVQQHNSVGVPNEALVGQVLPLS